MPRPRKCKRVCNLPGSAVFAPRPVRRKTATVMLVEEYETIRLIDYLGLTQEECAGQMEIARTTVQSLYASARKKLAGCIVNGAALKIGGGDYEVCNRRGGCRRKHRNMPCPHDAEKLEV